MAVANALCQRGSKCVTAAPWKSPMMAWSTVCDDYFRVADKPPGIQPFDFKDAGRGPIILMFVTAAYNSDGDLRELFC
jgi:hypothetical protein